MSTPDLTDIDRYETRKTSSAPEAAPLKVLFFDIETAPMLAYIWQQKTNWVGTHQIVHETYLLTWAAKWWHRKKVYGDKLTPEEAREQDDSRIVQSLADMLREADVIVAHNVDRFDLPMLNNRLMLLGLDPIGPVQTLDTLKLAKKSFRLASNKLNWLAKQLGIGHKDPMEFADWRGCYQGDEKSLAKMYRYNRKDVTLLQEVYERIEPYVKGLPRLVDADGTSTVLLCPTCGSDDLERDGHYRTRGSSFPQFACGNCGRASRSRRADTSKRLDLMPL